MRLSLFITVIASLIYLIPDAESVLQYDRVAIKAGEVWRILSCHLTHCSLDHYVWDVMAFTLLGIPCERKSRSHFLVCLLFSFFLIPLCVWLCHPQITIYRGLSGIDSALYALIAVLLLKDKVNKLDWRSAILIVSVYTLFVLKIVSETVTGTTFFVNSSSAEMVPLPFVHVVGAIVGTATGMIDTKKFKRWEFS